ncbi:MAG: hypothetical protein ACKOFU_02000 [Actinomycetota bacterium]
MSWRIFLEGEETEPVPFTRSQASDSGFYVFTINLSRNFSPGAYTVVARDSQGSVSLLAGVQVIDRIEYDILEIPLDLYFVLLLFIAFLALQISLRTWERTASVGAEVVGLHDPNPSPWLRGSSALMAQRKRWQSRWLGGDDYLVGEIPPSRHFLALSPVLVLVFALFAALQDLFFPLLEISSSLLLAFLAALALWDRHSGRLILITYLTIYIVFNSTLNAPTLLGLILLLSLFLVPRYVGDVVFSFVARLGGTDWRTTYLAISSSTLAVGLSGFWLYLLSESAIQSDSTEASRFTIVAITLAVSQFLRAMRIRLAETQSSLNEDAASRSETHVVGMWSTGIYSVVACGLIFSWTGDVAASLFITLIFIGSLFTIHLRTSSSSEFISRTFGSVSPLVPVAIVTALSAGVILWLSRFPEVVTDRSYRVLLLAGIPLVIFALLQMVAVVTRKQEQI